MRGSTRLLDEAESVNLFLYCASAFILKQVERSFPGLSALLAAKLRLLGLNPYEALAADAKKFADTLAKTFGGPDMAYRYLRAILPRDSMFDELLAALLKRGDASEIEETLVSVAMKYRRYSSRLCEAGGV